MRRLRLTDVPSERLLLHIAEHVLPEYIVCLATDLGIKDPEFGRIKKDLPLNPLEQTLRVNIDELSLS